MRHDQIFEMIDAGIRSEMDLKQATKYLDVLMKMDIKDARVYKKFKCMVRLMNYIRNQRTQVLVSERILANAPDAKEKEKTTRQRRFS